MPVEINAVIQQQSKTGAIREIQIISGKEVRIINGLKQRQQVYHISLLALADKSHVRLHIAKLWLSLLLGSVGLFLLLTGVRSFLAFEPGIYGVIIVSVLCLVALLSLIFLILNLGRKRVYFSRNAHVPLFDLLIGNPDTASYKSFIADLDQHIARARSSWNLSHDQQIAGEMKMLRRLVNEKVINATVYEQAKNHLFSLSGKKK